MNILFDGRPLADPQSGGVRRVALGLLTALRKQGANITVATTGATRPEISDQHLKLPNKLLSLALWLRLTSFDRLISHQSNILLLPNICWLGAPKLPYALVVHDLSFLIEPRWFSWKSRLWHRFIGAKQQIKNARIIFAVSECTKRDLMRLLNISPERIIVIPLGLNNLFQQAPVSSSEKPFLLAMGANDPRKNATLSRVVAKETNLDLKLIGDSSLGRVNDAELNRLYAQATAFLYPSWYEGFGLPLHEAAQHGTPCIASTAGALPETAPEGTIFASPSKPQHWIEAVHTILNHPSSHRTKTVINGWQPAAQSIIHHLARLQNLPHQT